MPRRLGRFTWLTIAALTVAGIVPTSRADEPVNDVNELIKVVQSNDEAAYLAAETLGHLGKKAMPAKEALLAACDSTNDRLRIAAALALSQIDLDNEQTAKIVVKTLINALASDDADTKREALRGLSKLRRAETEEVKLIAKALADSDDFVALHAADALVSIGERAVPVLIEATKNEQTVLWALLALGELGPKAKPALDAVIAKLKDPDPIIRQEAVLTIAKLDADPDKSVKAIIPLLDDPALIVRAAAGFAVSQFGSSSMQAVEKLQAMTKEKDELSQLIGARGLVMILAPRGAAAMPLVEILKVGLSNKRPGVREESARTLGLLGVDAVSAREDLEKATKDSEERVRTAATEALSAIGGNAADGEK